MKQPSSRMIAILKSKLNRYGRPGEYYYGGHLTYYEVKILTQHFNIKLGSSDCGWAKYCNDKLEKGENGSVWFYFHREGNKRVFKELELN